MLHVNSPALSLPMVPVGPAPKSLTETWEVLKVSRKHNGLQSKPWTLLCLCPWIAVLPWIMVWSFHSLGNRDAVKIFGNLVLTFWRLSENSFKHPLLRANLQPLQVKKKIMIIHSQDALSQVDNKVVSGLKTDVTTNKGDWISSRKHILTFKNIPEERQWQNSQIQHKWLLQKTSALGNFPWGMFANFSLNQLYYFKSHLKAES